LGFRVIASSKLARLHLCVLFVELFTPHTRYAVLQICCPACAHEQHATADRSGLEMHPFMLLLHPSAGMLPFFCNTGMQGAYRYTPCFATLRAPDSAARSDAITSILVQRTAHPTSCSPPHELDPGVYPIKDPVICPLDSPKRQTGRPADGASSSAAADRIGTTLNNSCPSFQGWEETLRTDRTGSMSIICITACPSIFLFVSVAVFVLMRFCTCVPACGVYPACACNPCVTTCPNTNPWKRVQHQGG
jgi:hypothetical protein